MNRVVARQFTDCLVANVQFSPNVHLKFKKCQNYMQIRLSLVDLRASSDRASTAAASLASKIQMGPRAIPSVIASDAAAAATWSERHKYKSM